MQTITVHEVYDERGEAVRVPTKYEVCFSCKGTGTSTRYLGAFTRDELDDLGPEFMEDYASGMYDRACDECHGQRVVSVIDTERATPQQLDAYDRNARALAELRAEEAAERRAGC